MGHSFDILTSYLNHLSSLYGYFLIFRNENDRAEGYEGGSVAKDVNGKKVEW